MERNTSIPKLVLLPGLDGTGLLFSRLIDTLPNTFDVLTVKYPTEKYLSYAELESLVRAACEGCGPFILIAESFSTPVAIKYAATRPNNFIGVVLCAGFVTAPVKSLRCLLALLISPFAFRIRLSSIAAQIWLLGRNAPASLLKAVADAIASVPPKVLAARLRAVLTCDVRGELRRIRCPILYIQASNDRLVNASCLREILLVKPDVVVSIVDGPHLLLQRSPNKATPAILRFIQLCNPS